MNLNKMEATAAAVMLALIVMVLVMVGAFEAEGKHWFFDATTVWTAFIGGGAAVFGGYQVYRQTQLGRWKLEREHKNERENIACALIAELSNNLYQCDQHYKAASTVLRIAQSHGPELVVKSAYHADMFRLFQSRLGCLGAETTNFVYRAYLDVIDHWTVRSGQLRDLAEGKEATISEERFPDFLKSSSASNARSCARALRSLEQYGRIDVDGLVSEWEDKELPYDQ